jgi:hypothetical protein
MAEPQTGHRWRKKTPRVQSEWRKLKRNRTEIIEEPPVTPPVVPPPPIPEPEIPPLPPPPDPEFPDVDVFEYEILSEDGTIIFDESAENYIQYEFGTGEIIDIGYLLTEDGGVLLQENGNAL